MKKTISILAAVMLVLSFAGWATAASTTEDKVAINCAGDAGNIDTVGCNEPGEQSSQQCDTFDFEDRDDYCEDTKQDNRGVFPICDCIPEPFDTVQQDQEYYLGMEILVDRNDGAGMVEGDNYVYWAEDVTSIDVMTFDSEGDACDTELSGYENVYVDDYISEGSFQNFIYYQDDNEVAEPIACPDTVSDINRAVRFETDLDTGVGYTITSDDDQYNASNWVIDIPDMWADFPNAEAGWTVYARVCITPTDSDVGGICGDCEKCCFLIKIGTLCCDSTSSDEDCADLLIFPYIPNPAGSFWFGMVVTNMSSTAGTATVMLYEADGDVAEGTIDLPANIPTVIDISALTLTTSVEGTLGNAQCWAYVVADVPASGFGFMANNTTYASMGYLAEKECNSCSRCSTWAKDLGFVCPR